MIDTTLQSKEYQDQFYLEVDSYVINAANRLLSIIVKPLLEFDKIKHIKLVNLVTERTSLIQKMLDEVEGESSFVLGNEVETERFKIKDYPPNFLKYIQQVPIEEL